ncbi:hypothetical protein C8Q74DRAFT_1362749 [Fomes fomentarius]|nr:hypothetical protein C8Q74DRAFT_1362749 [Fomes fomentarius]
MIQAFKKQRVEPKHTRTDKSCIACAKSKTKCERTADPTRCKKCAKKNLRCQWPEGEASRRACDECKRARTRCLQPRVPNGPCRECENANKRCSQATYQPGQPLLHVRGAFRVSNASPPSTSPGSFHTLVASSSTNTQSNAGPSYPTARWRQDSPTAVVSQTVLAVDGESRPSLHIDPQALADAPPTTPTSVASSPRSYWSTVLSSDDDIH